MFLATVRITLEHDPMGNCSRVEDDALVLLHRQSFIGWSYDGDDGGRARDEHASSYLYWSSPLPLDDDVGGM